MTHDRFRKLEQSRYDMIVIGAGIGGLTTAALCAKRGQSVLIVDQHYVAGGNATVFKRPGYEFDIGLHYLGHGEPSGMFPKLLRAAGVDDVRFLPMDRDGFDTLVFPDFELGVPRGLERYRLRLVDQFPSERSGIDRYVRLLREASELQSAMGAPRRLPGVLARSLLALRWANSTLGAFLDTCTRDPALRAVLAAENGDYAEPPSRASLALHAGLMLHYLDQGGFYPAGGGQVMSDRLAESIEANGGKLLLSTRVSRIMVENGRAVGVRLCNKHLGEREVRARHVVSNADIKRTYLELLGPEVVPDKMLERARAWEMAPALGMVYLGVDRAALGNRTKNTNYWVYSDYEIERRYAELREGRFSADPLLYVSIASLKDPENRRIAPAGVVNLQLMSLAPHQPEAWGVTPDAVATGAYRDQPAYQARKAEYTDGLLRAAERVFPNLRQHVRFQELATPLTHSRYTLSSGGTSYGLALTPEQFLWKRPGAKTKLPGLILCGASTRMGHGIGGSMMSGVAAAAAIVGPSVYQEVFAPSTARATTRPASPIAVRKASAEAARPTA